MTPLYFDLETVPRLGAEIFLRDPKPHGNLKDPVKIAADVEAKRLAALPKLALDPFGCRIVAAAWTNVGVEGGIVVHECHDEIDEQFAVMELFRQITLAPEIIGHGIKSFDLPVLIARAWLLDIFVPVTLRQRVSRKYDPSIIDIYDVVTFGKGYIKDAEKEQVIARSLTSMCQVFGLDIPDDDCGGADIAALVAAGDWAAVARHVRRDVERIQALARRLRVSVLDDVDPARLEAQR